MVGGRARARRAPALPHSSWQRLRGVLLLLVAIVAAGALWLTLDGRFYVSRVVVVGASRSSPDEVARASGLPGLHVLWVHPAEIEAHLLRALPDIESVQVACGLSARCTITVVERQPRVVWDEDGQWWWIDAEGVIFAASPSGGEVSSFLPSGGEVSSFLPSGGDASALPPSGGDASALPPSGGDASALPPSGGDDSALPPSGGDKGGERWLVQGPLPRREDGRLNERVRVALSELWSAGIDVPSPLTYAPGRGLAFTDERGWRVILGEGPGMAERLQVLEWLVADLQARGLAPRFVDVRFPDAPYYSLTNDW